MLPSLFNPAFLPAESDKEGFVILRWAPFCSALIEDWIVEGQEYLVLALINNFLELEEVGLRMPSPQDNPGLPL